MASYRCAWCGRRPELEGAVPSFGICVDCQRRERQRRQLSRREDEGRPLFPTWWYVAVALFALWASWLLGAL